MAHLVLSRKYRPQRFEDLVGQEAVAQTLSNAISSGRIGHAYLFIGPRGTGKTTTARIFAKALNCERGPTPTPCGECPSCRDVTAGSDLDVVELDAASHNGVDDVRALRDSVGYRPARSRFRVWIVDEVHMLSTPAFNAFLKTLEEPPPQAKFVFCTTEAHRLPETFTSRCQRIEFRRIDEGKMADRLRSLLEREEAEAEPGVLERIAAGALGGLRDAESLLEQLLAASARGPGSGGGRVTVADLDAVLGRAPEERVTALLDAIEAGDASAALSAAEACLATGSKPDVLLDQALDAFRAALRPAALAGPTIGGAAASGGASPGGAAARGGADAPRGARLGLARVARSIDLLLEKRRHLREGADGRLVVEVAAVELARLPSAHDLDAVIRALRAGEAATGSGAAAGRGGGSVEATGAPGGASAVREGAGGARRAAAPPGEAAPRVDRADGPDGGGGPYGPRASVAGGPGAASPAAPRSATATHAATAVANAGALASPGCAVPAGAPRASERAVALADVLARWDDVVRGVEARSRRLHACLARARPVSVVGDVLLLALPETETVARAILRDRDAGGALREATKEVLGTSLRAAVADGVAAAGHGVGGGGTGGPARPVPRGPSHGPAAVSAAPAPVAPRAGAASRTAAAGTAPSASSSTAASSAANGAGAGSPPSAPPPSSAGGAGAPRADDVRANPQVRALLEGFSARLLSVERTAPPDAAGAASPAPSAGA